MHPHEPSIFNLHRRLQTRGLFVAIRKPLHIIVVNAKRIISDYFKRIGRKGGMAGRGRAKARTRKQASMAAKKRWANGFVSKKKNVPRNNISLLGSSKRRRVG